MSDQYKARTVVQRPGEDLDYGFTFVDTLLEDSDTISSSVWAFDGDDTALTLDGEDHSDNITVVWVSGGTEHEKYEVTNTVTTSAGRTFVRAFFIQIQGFD